MAQPFVSNLILRIENAEIKPHAELEDVSTSKERIYIKDYDVFLLKSEQEVVAAILNAARIAAEITTGQKYIHVSMPHETCSLRIAPTVLKTVAESGCALEIY